MRQRVGLAFGLFLLLTLVPGTLAADPFVVNAGLVLVSLGNYDVNRGTYIADFYLWLRWAPRASAPDFVPDRFEFMNGRAISREKIFEETKPTGERERWWRIQASLFSDPDFRQYPYDTQTIEIVFEDAAYQIDTVVYEPLLEVSGLDDAFHIAGWRILGWSMQLSNKRYKFHETYSRVRLEVRLRREALAATFKSFLPPFAFMFVSALSFFFHPSKLRERIGLGTSMLIAAVGFHITQTLGFPPMGTLSLFDKAMLAVYAFLAGSLVVTTLLAIDEDYWKDVDHTRPINFYGSLGTVALALIVFGLLMLL